MLPETPLVSIILPTFNRCGSLTEAIESCRAQTYAQWELLIVDDGSTDGTPEVGRRFSEQDKRILYLRKENGGLPRALNYGFERACGDLLTWISDDNRYLPEAIEKMVEMRRRQVAPCLIHTDYWAWNPETDERKLVSHGSGASLSTKNIVGACFLYDRAIQERVGLYDPDYFLVEDYEYWLRISCLFSLVHLPEPLYLYSYHGESLTSLRSFEIKALIWMTRLKYRQVSWGAFLKAYRKNLSRLSRSNITLKRKVSTGATILRRSARLWLKPLPICTK